MRFTMIIAVAGLAGIACSTKSGNQSVRDGGLDSGRAAGGSGSGGTGAGFGGMPGTGGFGSGGNVGSGGVGGAGAGGTGTGGASAAGGVLGTGGMSTGGTGAGGVTATGGVPGGGGTGPRGGAGGGSAVDASVDKPTPTFGTPCGSQADCGLNSTFLYCRAPGEPYGCGICLPAVDACASDADCVPDGGGTEKRICDPPPSWQCYCSPVKLCVAGCRSNADCGAGQACNESHACEKTCVAGDGTCPVDFSCAVSGFCRRNACTSDSQCSVACVNGACYSTRGACEGPAA